MAHQFQDDEKEIREFAETMPFGVSKVNLLLAEGGETEDGKPFVELSIVNESGIEDKARVWFVGGAVNISFNTLTQILVHNQTTEKAKEQMREAVKAAKDSDELAALLNEHAMNGELWFTKYYDANGRTYTNDRGTFKSVNKNVMGYEPKLKSELMPQPKTGNESVDPNDYPDDGFIPKDAEASSTIPQDKDWAK